MHPQLRRSNLDCDEFPFATTYGGAAQHACDATAPADKFSAKMIDSAENQTGGSQLGVYYGYDRIIDGSVDAFYVEITAKPRPGGAAAGAPAPHSVASMPDSGHNRRVISSTSCGIRVAFCLDNTRACSRPEQRASSRYVPAPCGSRNVSGVRPIVPALLTARTAYGAWTHAGTRQLARSPPPCTGRPIP